MIKHTDFEDSKPGKLKLRVLINEGKICFGGNIILKIYGTLNCKSGKRMKRENRIFFSSQQEANAAGYRSCGHCMHDAYVKWKQ
jgi:methylphosphotriester-DNA--protein-cysteine methyltransferase